MEVMPDNAVSLNDGVVAAASESATQSKATPWCGVISNARKRRDLEVIFSACFIYRRRDDGEIDREIMRKRRRLSRAI